MGYDYSLISAEAIKTRWVAGVDEAGRGSWAGPLAVGMVVQPVSELQFMDEQNEKNRAKGLPPKRLAKDAFAQDSKKLTPAARAQWYTFIRQSALWARVVWANPRKIDELNINGATKWSIDRLLGLLPQEYMGDITLLIDGHFPFTFPVPVHYIIDGDACVDIIGRASILAKVRRDNLMSRLNRYLPEYQFDRHKGYGTRLHQQMLDLHGVSSLHRYSYVPIQKRMGTELGYMNYEC